jgi:hypothetical protein
MNGTEPESLQSEKVARKRKEYVGKKCEDFRMEREIMPEDLFGKLKEVVVFNNCH